MWRGSRLWPLQLLSDPEQSNNKHWSDLSADCYKAVKTASGLQTWVTSEENICRVRMMNKEKKEEKKPKHRQETAAEWNRKWGSVLLPVGLNNPGYAAAEGLTCPPEPSSSQSDTWRQTAGEETEGFTSDSKTHSATSRQTTTQCPQQAARHSRNNFTGCSL